jgi:hypothetical protein
MSNEGLKQVSSKASIFDNKPKIPSAEKFKEVVDQNQEQDIAYKKQFAELAQKFIDMINDTTLSEQKGVVKKDLERETLARMLKLAEQANNDPNQPESAGSLAWITILLKTCLIQRNKLNEMSYKIHLLETKK